MAAKKKKLDLDAILARPPAKARAELRELLAGARGAARRPIEVALHRVADLGVLRELLAGRKLEPSLVRTSALADLHADLAASIGSTPRTTVQREIEASGVLGDPIAHGEDDAPREFRASAYALLLRILDERAYTLRARAAEALRRLDPAAAEADLVARFRREADRPAMRRWTEWARLGAPRERPAVMDALFTAVLAGNEELEDAAVVAKHAGEIPAAFRAPLLARYGRSKVLAKPLAAALVADTNDPAALLAILEDRDLAASHAAAAAKLDPSLAPEIIARAGTLAPGVVAVALEALGPVRVLAQHARDPALYAALLLAPRALRHEGWFAEAPALPDGGRELYVAMARDPQHGHRGRAVEALAALVAAAPGRLEKRHALFALGATGHPDATLPLLAALEDPDLTDTAPLVCTALGACGDTRAIPVLARHRGGRHGSFIEGAIRDIEDRTAEIHRSALAAAIGDGNAAIRDLATRAAAGDEEAAIVLEDALREMGRL